MAKVKLPGEAKLKDPKHELFCVLWAGVASGYYFGNATRSYMHAFGKEKEIEAINLKVEKTYELPTKKGEDARRVLKNKIKSIENSARASSARLLAIASIFNRTNYLLDRYLSDDYADREMAYVISQREDLMAKVAAYREVAKVKERIRGAGAITGEFTFEWEKDDDKNKPKGVKVKATVKSSPEDGDMEAVFS